MMGQIPLLAPFIGMWFTDEFMNIRKLRVRAYVICLGVHGQKHHCFGLLAIPHFFRCPPPLWWVPFYFWMYPITSVGYVGTPISSGRSPLLCVLFVSVPSSVGTQTLQYLLASMLVRTENQEFYAAQTLSCKIPGSLISIHWRTHPVPSNVNAPQ